jgi:dodecin
MTRIWQKLSRSQYGNNGELLKDMQVPAVGNYTALGDVRQEDTNMTDHVYKTIELTGSSPKGIQEAITTAVSRASKTLHNLRWFEVNQVRGEITADKVAHWQVTLKVGFTLDDNPNG